MDGSIKCSAKNRTDEIQRSSDQPEPDDPVAITPSPSINKRFRWWVRDRLFDVCESLNSISKWLQHRIIHQTLEQRRAVRGCETPLSEMDQDLLAMFIRWNGHKVEKTVRYARTVDRGSQVASGLQLAVDEWRRRSLPQQRFLEWAQDNLNDYERWVETGVPQTHPEKDLPAFEPTSPVWEVLKNRVSTRFWQPRSVEDEKIEQILSVATYAPTSCNRQTWKIYVRKNPDIEMNSKLSGVSNIQLMEKAPVAMYIAIDSRLYPEIYAAAEDAGIMGLQLSLAATSLGLAGCLMYGAENFPQQDFREKFAVPDHRYVYLTYLLGYPAERTLTTKRADPDDVAIYI